MDKIIRNTIKPFFVVCGKFLRTNTILIFLICTTVFLLFPISDCGLGIGYLAILSLTLILILVVIFSNKHFYKIQEIIYYAPLILFSFSISFSKNCIIWKTSILLEEANKYKNYFISFLIISTTFLIILNIFVRKGVSKVYEGLVMISSAPNFCPFLVRINELEQKGILTEENAEKLREGIRQEFNYIDILEYNTRILKFLNNAFTLCSVVTLFVGSAVGVFLKSLTIKESLSISSFFFFINTILMIIPLFIFTLLLNPLLEIEKSNADRWWKIIDNPNESIIFPTQKPKEIIEKRLNNELIKLKVTSTMFFLFAIFCSFVPMFSETKIFTGYQAIIMYYTFFFVIILLIPSRYLNNNQFTKELGCKLYPRDDYSLNQRILDVNLKRLKNSKEMTNIYPWIILFKKFYDSYLILHFILFFIILFLIFLKNYFNQSILFSSYYGISGLTLVMQFGWFKICSNYTYNIIIEWFDEELYGDLVKKMMNK